MGFKLCMFPTIKDMLKLKNYVGVNSLKTVPVYYSLIHSHLQYCITSWDMASANALDLLEKLHTHIVRILTNSSYRAHTNSLFGKLNLLKLKHICALKIAKKCITTKQTLIFTQVVPYPKLHKFIHIITGLLPKWTTHSLENELILVKIICIYWTACLAKYTNKTQINIFLAVLAVLFALKILALNH